MQVFGADRLKYPMKRKNWSLDNPNGDKRGEDEWERISWDEAYTIIAETTKKLYDKYGPETCFVAGGSYFPKVLQGLGGFTPRWGQVSWGAWPDVYATVTGLTNGHFWNGPDRFTLRKQKLMIFWGVNPAVSSAGLPHYNYIQARKAGTEFVVIDPRYTETAPSLDAPWIPIRPGTDTAMVLGMIQHIIASGLHDKEYLDKYCVGFDRDHMPPAEGEEFTYSPAERVPFVFKPRAIDPDDNNRELLSVGRKIAEPLYEAKSDREIAMGLADKLHELYPEEYPYTGEDVSGVSEWQQFLNKLAGCKYTDTDGEKKTLLTITQADVDRLSAEAGEELTLEPQEGVMDVAEFEARGGFQIPNPEEYVNLPFKSYIDDPEANPLNTPSGKFEIHCQLLSDYIEWVGFSSKSPLPLYKRITEGYEDGVENDLPFQFINHHYQRRSHHVFDNLTWLREAFPQELWINADDAKKLDIKTGDIVLVEGTRGKIARPAYVTERIAPGVISVGEGAWAELNKETKKCRRSGSCAPNGGFVFTALRLRKAAPPSSCGTRLALP